MSEIISLQKNIYIPSFDENNDDCRFAVSEEGAGIVRIQRDGDSDVLRLDWSVEWVTVAAPGNAARAMAHGEPMPELPGLFA